MDSMLLLFVGLVVAIAIEVGGYHLYKHRRAKRESQLSQEKSPVLYEALLETTSYLCEAEQLLKIAQQEYEKSSEGGGSFSSDRVCLLEGIRRGKSSQRSLVHEYAQKLGVCFESKPLVETSEAPEVLLAIYAKEAEHWAYVTLPAMVARVKKEGHGKIAKELSTIGEVEAAHAKLSLALLNGTEDSTHEASLCPSCGSIYFGRRPAFCLACSNPGFDMDSIRAGLL